MPIVTGRSLHRALLGVHNDALAPQPRKLFGAQIRFERVERVGLAARSKSVRSGENCGRGLRTARLTRGAPRAHRYLCRADVASEVVPRTSMSAMGQKRTSIGSPRMSALGHERTCSSADRDCAPWLLHPTSGGRGLMVGGANAVARHVRCWGKNVKATDASRALLTQAFPRYRRRRESERAHGGSRLRSND